MAGLPCRVLQFAVRTECWLKGNRGWKANLHSTHQACWTLGLRVAVTVGRKGHLFEICSYQEVLFLHSALQRGPVCQLWPGELGLTTLFSTCIPRYGTLAINENICRSLPVNEVKTGQLVKCQDGEFGALPSQAPTSATTLSPPSLSSPSPRAPCSIL